MTSNLVVSGFKPYRCLDCGAKISCGAVRCRTCNRLNVKSLTGTEVKT